MWGALSTAGQEETISLNRRGTEEGKCRGTEDQPPYLGIRWSLSPTCPDVADQTILNFERNL